MITNNNNSFARVAVQLSNVRSILPIGVACAFGLLMYPAVAQIDVTTSQKISTSTPQKTQKPAAVEAQSKLPAQSQKGFSQTIRLLHKDEVKKVANNFAKLVYRYDNDLLQQSVQQADKGIAELYQQLGLEFKFATVQGSIDGLITGDDLAAVSVQGNTFVLTLPSQIKASKINMPDFTVNTYGKTVKFARLSTLSQLDERQSAAQNVIYNKGAAFVDGKTLQSLALVYTSDKVSFTGVQSVAGMEYQYEVFLPEQGWHWVQLLEKGNKTRIRRVDSDRIDPVIIAF